MSHDIKHCDMNPLNLIRCYSANSLGKFAAPATIKCVLRREADPRALVSVNGWVTSIRRQKHFSFAVISDGSTINGIQTILDNEKANSLSTGTCVELKGYVVSSPGKEQNKELQVQAVRVLGECDSTYPLQKKRHSLEFLRTIGHLRSRSKTGSAVARVRSAAIDSLQRYFLNNDFIQVNTPIITSHDCEGGGETFRINPVPQNPSPQAPSDFFGKPAYLTVSGQLHAEILASALSRVFTFGPVFRAEESLTSRHLAEFWMLEAEIAFIEHLDQLLPITEDSIRSSTEAILNECEQDITFFNTWVDKTLMDKLRKSIEMPFVRMSYTDAVQILQNSGKSFKFSPNWGASLQSEHERYLATEYCKQPVFVTDYPRHLKPFYMLENNDDRETVACFDLLVPNIGELVGGSLRENRYDILERKIEDAKMNVNDYQWYLDLRKYGSAPHGGFGIGFERYMLWLTGLENVREVVPMPRWVGNCRY